MAPVPQFVRDTLDRITTDARRPDRAVRVEGHSIALDFRYSAQLHADLMRHVPSVSFDAGGRHSPGLYRAPLSAALDVDRWCKSNGFDGIENLAAYVDRAIALRDASERPDGNVDLPASFDDLRHYQRASVEYATLARRAFIADEMGLGKTPVALATIEQRGAYPAVIVCPATLRLNWQKEARRWAPGRATQIVTGTRPHRQAVLGGVLGSADITILSYDVLYAWGPQLAGAFAVVFDESHYCKSNVRGPVCPECDVKVPRGTLADGPYVCRNGHPYEEPAMEYKVRRTRAAKRLAETVAPGGLVLALTGTPITNRVEEFVSQLDILNMLDAFGGQAAFLGRYAPDRNLNELHARLRSLGYIRHRKDDPGIADELPPKLWADRIVEPDPEPMAVYEQAEENIVAFLAARAAQIAAEIGEDPTSAATMAALRASAAENLVRFTTLKRLAAHTKATAIREWGEAMVDGGEQIVIAAHHRDVVDGLAADFGGVKIQGGMTTEQIEQAKATFQEGDADVMVLSTQAGKTGHTLTAASNMAFVELPWTPGDLDQTLDRCHRIGQRDSVTGWVLLARGTIDEDVYAMIQAKRRVVTAATDGRQIDVDHDEDAEALDTIANLTEVFARRGLAVDR